MRALKDGKEVNVNLRFLVNKNILLKWINSFNIKLFSIKKIEKVYLVETHMREKKKTSKQLCREKKCNFRKRYYSVQINKGYQKRHFHINLNKFWLFKTIVMICHYFKYMGVGWWSGRSPGKGNGNPLQYSGLENPHGQRSLVGYSPWGPRESDMTKWLSSAAEANTWENKTHGNTKTKAER